MGFLGRLFVLTGALLALGTTPALAGSVTVHIDGRGTVISGPEGISCVKDGDADPSSGCVATFCTLKCDVAEVGLRPTPAGGFSFREWKPRKGSPECEAIDRQDICTVVVGRTTLAELTAVFADVQAPAPTLAKLPAAVRGTLNLKASATDNVGVSSVRFTVNGTVVPAVNGAGGWAATATPAEGVAHVTATAVDPSGNEGTTSETTVLIDNSAPAVDVAGPDGGQAFGPGSTQSWKLAATDATGVASLRCGVVATGAAPSFGSCSGAGDHTVSGLGEGAYTFAVEAKDPLGNTGVTTRAFSIDATPPLTSITAGVGDGASTSTTALSWEFSANEAGSSFACRVYPAALTPGAFAPCSSAAAHTASGFAPGVYTFEVRATDPAGNVETAPAKQTFTVMAPVAIASGAGAGQVLAATTKPPQILATLAFAYANSTKKQTKLTSLIVKNVPAGATVTASCPKSCGKKSFKKTGASGTVSLAALLKKPLKAGTLITVVISKPGSTSAVKILKVQPRKSPTVSTQCQPEGAAKPGAC